jgi:Do/DeqQ family serine protease
MRYQITRDNFSFKKIKTVVTSLTLFFIFSIFFLVKADGSVRRNAVVVAAEKVSPAVINISTIVRERVNPLFPFSRDNFFRDFFPDLFSREYTRTSLGSGVIIDGNSGYIVTNHHVVAKATQIKVMTSDGKEFKARILGSDPRSDLAVLKIDAKKKLPEIEMGNSNDLMIGETVIAIGNPFGLSHTVTTGVISALNRAVRTEERVYRNFIQTDASINPGNSGGPLLNIDGELIGINTAIYQKAQGIGFAIPINKAKRIVKELLNAGEVRLPWIGLELQELTEELRNYFGVPKETTGALVNDVVHGSPAAKAGLKRGDIILSLGEIPISSPQDYRESLEEFVPADRLKITIFRKGKEMTVSLQPAPFPLDYALDLVYQRLGIQVGNLDKKTRQRYGLKGAVSIEKVRKDSEAGRIGLESGDLILQVNDIPVKNLEEFKKAISRFRHLPALTLLVRRGPYGYSLTLPF